MSITSCQLHQVCKKINSIEKERERERERGREGGEVEETGEAAIASRGCARITKGLPLCFRFPHLSWLDFINRGSPRVTTALANSVAGLNKWRACFPDPIRDRGSTLGSFLRDVTSVNPHARIRE